MWRAQKPDSVKSAQTSSNAVSELTEKGWSAIGLPRIAVSKSRSRGAMIALFRLSRPDDGLEEGDETLASMAPGFPKV